MTADRVPASAARDRLAMARINARYGARKRWERLLRFIVWRLPRQLVTWAYVRVVAHATTGQYGSTIVPELTAMDALKRWDDDC